MTSRSQFGGYDQGIMHSDASQARMQTHTHTYQRPDVLQNVAFVKHLVHDVHMLCKHKHIGSHEADCVTPEAHSDRTLVLEVVKQVHDVLVRQLHKHTNTNNRTQTHSANRQFSMRYAPRVHGKHL
jgi:hypothetical protein